MRACESHLAGAESIRRFGPCFVRSDPISFRKVCEVTMVVEYIRYSCSDAKRREELVHAYREAARALDKAPECVG